MPTASAVLGRLKGAIDKHRARRAVAGALRTADWAKVPAAIRDRAFFSAGVENTRLLDLLRRRIDEALAGAAPGEPGMSRERFIHLMRTDLGVVGEGDTNDLTDIASARRLGLIYDMAVEEAVAYVKWRAGMDPDILDEYPCQELIRVRDAMVPRDWEERWAAEGGEFPDRRMIARKTDPIWTHISRFGRPWPPFDFNSGMALKNISRDEAESIGAIRKGEVLKPLPDPGFNKNLSASVHDFSPEALHELLAMFDGKARIEGERIVWDPPEGGRP